MRIYVPLQKMTGRTQTTRGKKNAEAQAGTQGGNGNHSGMQPPTRASPQPRTEASQAVPSAQEHRQQEEQQFGESQNRSRPDIPSPSDEGQTLKQILLMLVRQNAAAPHRSGPSS